MTTENTPPDPDVEDLPDDDDNGDRVPFPIGLSPIEGDPSKVGLYGALHSDEGGAGE